MTLTYIWCGFFIVGFIAALAQWIFAGDTEVFKRIIDGTFKMAKFGVMDIALPLAGIMTLWLGLLSVGEKAGAITWIARLISPFFSRIFPQVPKEHPATGHMVMNFSANFLGLDNAATPFGLKSMASLQELNPKKDEASDAMIMFTVLHASGLTLIPLSIMAQRMVLGAQNPADIFIPCMIATYVATVAGLVIVAIKQRINLFDPVILGWLGTITTAIVALVWSMSTMMSKEQITLVSSVVSNLLLLSIMIAFIGGALWKKINVYDAFIEGAKGGIETSLKIIPYLVGMLVAIAVLRESGVLDFILQGLTWFFNLTGVNSDFVAALPTALMKPVSGSGARAMMIETMTTYGVDSFAGRLAAVFQGSADTTFYIAALYYGYVGINKIRYAIGYGLIAEFAGVIAAIFVAYLFFH
jgi:spore maturation protein SpmA